MASLYELTGDYAKFAEIAQQGELDDDMQAMLDDAALEGIAHLESSQSILIK